MKRIVYRVSWDKHVLRWKVMHKALRLDFFLQAVAINAARERAKSTRADGGLAQVVLHGKDGRIRWERTYGRDPKRSKG